MVVLDGRPLGLQIGTVEYFDRPQGRIIRVGVDPAVTLDHPHAVGDLQDAAACDPWWGSR